MHNTAFSCSCLSVGLIFFFVSFSLFVLSWDKLLISDRETDDTGCFFASLLAADQSGNFVAVSFRYHHPLPHKSFALPFVCLYLLSTRPHLSLTFLSIIDNNNQRSSNQGISHLITPVEMEFSRSPAFCAETSGCGPLSTVQLAVRWSNQVVSMSPCQTVKK